MTAITEALSSALLHFVWQGTVVACLLWITLFILRKRSPDARYLASCAALLVLAILPVVTMYAGYAAPAPPVLSGSRVVAADGPVTAAEDLRPMFFASAWFTWIQSWTLPAWSLGVLLFSTRIVWGCKHVYALKRRGEPPGKPVTDIVEDLARRMDIHRRVRRVRILISSMADSPSVVGWLRPVILLPAASVLGLTALQLEAVIAHELAHIRRHDYFVSALQAVIETLLFYHPAVWWTSSQIRHERELCCDDLAVRACGDAVCYARALTKLEKQRVLKPKMVLGSTDGSLLYRIQRLIGVKTQEYGPSKLSGAFVLLLGIAGFAANLSWAAPEPPRLQGWTTANEERPAGQIERPGTMAPPSADRAGVSVNLGASTVLHRTLIEYPKTAMEQGVQGNLALEVTLDSTGNVADARVLSGPAELRRAALASVLDWHFAPGTPRTQVVHIGFDLEAAKTAKEEFSAFVTSADQTADQMKEKRGKAEKELIELKVKQAKIVEGSKAFFITAERGDVQITAQAAEIDKMAAAAERLALKRQLEEVQKQLELTSTHNDSGFRAAAEARLKQLHQMLVRLDRGLLENRAPAILDRPLGNIRIIGLPEQSRQELISSLPVRQSEILNRQSLELLGDAIRKFDEHLKYHFIPLEDKVELQIIAPGPR